MLTGKDAREKNLPAPCLYSLREGKAGPIQSSSSCQCKWIGGLELDWEDRNVRRPGERQSEVQGALKVLLEGEWVLMLDEPVIHVVDELHLTLI